MIGRFDTSKRLPFSRLMIQHLGQKKPHTEPSLHLDEEYVPGTGWSQRHQVSELWGTICATALPTSHEAASSFVLHSLTLLSPAD